jgi:hypothetical protein
MGAKALSVARATSKLDGQSFAHEIGSIFASYAVLAGGTTGGGQGVRWPERVHDVRKATEKKDKCQHKFIESS